MRLVSYVDRITHTGAGKERGRQKERRGEKEGVKFTNSRNCSLMALSEVSKNGGKK